MIIYERYNGGATVLDIGGRIVGGSDAEDFHTKIERLCSRGIHRVVLNLRKLRWISSCGTGIILREHEFMRSRGGNLKIAEPNERLNHVFFTLHVDRVLQIYETEEDAIVDFYRAS